MNNDNLNSLNNLNNIQETSNISNDIEIIDDAPKKKNKSKLPKIIIIILIVIVLGLVGYIIYDKVFNKPANNDNNVIQENKLDVSSNIVTDTYNKFIHGYESNCNTELEMYFNNKEIFNKDIKNKDAFNIALKLISAEKNDLIISGDDMLNKVRELFGNDYTFTNQTYNDSVKYDSEKNEYTISMYNPENYCNNSKGDLSKIVSAKSIGDNLELEVRVIFKGPNKYIYYSDYNKSKMINSFGDLTFENEELIEDDYSKGDLYKIVFTKVNDNYIYNSSKLLSESIYNSSEKIIEDMEVKSILDDKIGVIEAMSENSFVVPNLYKENVTSIDDQNKLLTVLNYIYQKGKFTKVMTPSDNISFYISTLKLTDDKLIGTIKMDTIKEIYDALYSSPTESISSKEKYQYTNTCPVFIYDNENKEYYAYLTCPTLNSVTTLGYNSKYTVLKDKIIIYRSVGYKQNDVIHTSFKEAQRLGESDSKNFINIDSTNYHKFDQYIYQFTMDNAKEFKFVSVTK